MIVCYSFFFQAEDGIRDLVRSRGLGDVYKRQHQHIVHRHAAGNGFLQYAFAFRRVLAKPVEGQWPRPGVDIGDAVGEVTITLHDHQWPEYLLPVSYTHLRAHETVLDLVCRLLLDKKTNY